MNAIDQRLLHAARTVEIRIAEVNAAVLIRRSVAHYNERARPGQPRATVDSDQHFLHRLCVNWLRHTGSGYDTVRDDIRRHGGQTLSDTAGVIIKQRVLAEIGCRYPWLAVEAARQHRALTEPGLSQRRRR